MKEEWAGVCVEGMNERDKEAASIGRFIRQYVNQRRCVLVAHRHHADEQCASTSQSSSSHRWVVHGSQRA